MITTSGWSMVCHITILAVLEHSSHLLIDIVGSLDVLIPYHLLHPPRVEGDYLILSGYSFLLAQLNGHLDFPNHLHVDGGSCQLF